MKDNKNLFSDYLWDNDPYNHARKTDDERVEEVVGIVVSDLESLDSLNLGRYNSFKKQQNNDKSN